MARVSSPVRISGADLLEQGPDGCAHSLFIDQAGAVLEQVITHQCEAGFGKFRIPGQGLLEMVFGNFQATVGKDCLLLKTFQVAVVGAQILRVHNMFCRAGISEQRGAQRVCDIAGDFVLDREDVLKRSRVIL